MTADPRWARLVDLFAAATELPVAERASFVARADDDDPALGDALRAMLAAHDDERQLEVERKLVSGDTAASEESASLPTGTMLGAYRVVAPVARGGMGEVYRAERVDGTYKQTVAVKVLRAGR